MHETALAYSYLARYDSAITLLRTSAHIQQSFEGGSKSKEFANNIYHMGQAFMMAGEYDSARYFLNEAEEIRKKIAGEESYDYAASLYGLGYLDIETGDFPSAEKRLIACRNILKTIEGQKSADYALCNSALANLYIELNLLQKAEPLLLENLATEEEVLGTNHPNYASTLNDLGGLYNEWGDVDKAEKYYLQALKLRETIFGKFHSAYAESLNNLAGVYADNQQFDQAIELYAEAAEVTKKIVGENHGDYSNILSNMALAYERTGNYPKAESLLASANEINRKVLGEQHPQYSMTLRNLALVYLDDKKYDQAELVLKKALNIQVQQARNNFSMLTEKEKTSLIDFDFAGMYLENNLLLQEKNKSPDLLRSNFDELLFLKSVSLSDTRNLVASIRNSANPTVKSLFSKWQELRSVLAKQYSLPVSNRMSGMDSVEQQAADVEKKLNDLSSEFRKQQQAINIRTNDIQRNLRDDEVAIEFVNFNLLTTQLTDTIIYAAYVLNKKDPAPVFIPLCREDQLRKYFSSSLGASGIKSIYRSEVADEDSTSPVSGDSLFSQVWKPLQPYLKGVKKIDYSPAGLLNRIAFHALPVAQNRLLIDDYELDRYTSIRQLASVGEQSRTKSTSIILFGDPAFTMDSASVAKQTATGNVSTIYSSAISRGGGSEPWVRLSGTGKEISDISSQFLKNGISTATYIQEEATEEKFKSLNGNSPTILHVATHGFFLPGPQKKNKDGFAMDRRNAFTVAEDPMLRSGIVLAGANRVWIGKPPIENREDGIVTALEISQLDLRSTDLVVLSACETALGDIQGTEGVFGLQRAFKLAGVKNMLLSLWKVPDEETAELMRTFYGYYLKGEMPREALKDAQRDLRKKYSPYYWAAFVLIE
jgi:CHAT domain-containing protein/tetratricopeptide (TPR) repeat protein